MASSSGSRRTARAGDFTAPLTIPGSAVAGAEIVHELAPEYSLTAWQVLRSALMWAGEEPALRGDLFERCAMVDWERELLEATWEHELRCPLAVIVGELRDATQAAPEAMARACLCVTEWALPRGFVGTGLAFAEAAALCWPDHPRYAWTVGRLMRTYGRLREAEQWLKRSNRIAVSNGDWETQSLAMSSIGNLFYEAGNYRQAETSHQKALRVSRKHGVRDREGEILHDLFVATWFQGKHEEAEEFARAAFEHYRHGHPRLPALAHDVAFTWLSKGHYARALKILMPLLPHFTEAEQRVHVLGSIARAAGGCGDAALHADMADQVWTLAEQPHSGQGVAAALVEVALGAACLSDWDQAERALTRAGEIAQVRSEADVLTKVEDMRDSVRARRAAEPRRNALDTVALPRLDHLANGFRASLLATAAA